MRQELDLICATREQGGVEGKVLFDPIGANAIALHGAGGRQTTGLSNRLVIEEGFDIAADVCAAEGKPESGCSARRVRGFEGDGPSRAAHVSISKSGEARSGLNLFILLAGDG